MSNTDFRCILNLATHFEGMQIKNNQLLYCVFLNMYLTKVSAFPGYYKEFWEHFNARQTWYSALLYTVYPKKYAHGFVVLCFVVVMQSFMINSHEVFIHIHLGCFAGTGAIVRLPQWQWSKPDGYGKISQCITTTKHSKAKTVCIFLGIYCSQTQSSEP